MAEPAPGTLPFKLIAGAIPCQGGWLISSARLKGSTFAPDVPKVVERLGDVIHRRPPYSLIAVNAPLGASAAGRRGERTCDVLATSLLGRSLMEGRWRCPDGGDPTDQISAEALEERLDEVAEVMAPYLQRTVVEVLPDLTFFQLNEEQPFAHANRTVEGYDERARLLAHVPGSLRIVEAVESGASRYDLLDAAAALWSARRVVSRAGKRVPALPEWDADGLRVEILR